MPSYEFIELTHRIFVIAHAYCVVPPFKEAQHSKRGRLQKFYIGVVGGAWWKAMDYSGALQCSK